MDWASRISAASSDMKHGLRALDVG